MRKIVIFLTALIGLNVCWSGARLSAAEPIRLYYNERPPFKMRLPDGGIAGLALAPAANAFAQANIPVIWEELPASRQIEYVKAGKIRGCAVGFYKTAEREKYAKFTAVTSQDSQFVLFARRNLTIPESIPITNLLNNPDYRLLLKQSNSYGRLISEAILSAKAQVELSANNMANILKMIQASRADLTLVLPEEIEYYRKAGLLDPSLYRVVTVTGIPPSEARYMMCSKAVEDDMINRVNQALGAPR